MARARAKAVTEPLLQFDWRNPDYGEIIKARQRNILFILEQPPSYLESLKNFYRRCPADFISDWGMTFDPRNADIGMLTTIPFVLFPRQREWVDWVIDRWENRRPGLCEKSRDMGVSWLAMALSCTLCMLHDGIAIGFGSRKTEYVDKIGTLKPLLPKGRIFMENVPAIFRPSYLPWRDAPYMRITFPDTGSLIAGEGGDDIGRGDRTTMYFVDEFAHFERAELTEASLSQTTNCRIDMSSVRGMNNAFARKRHSGKVDVFIFDWREDPRKDKAWYDKQVEDLDPIVVAQEIDRDYQASVSGVLIQAKWALAAINAHAKLGIAPAGMPGMAVDVADEGVDKNAICLTKGVSIERTEERSGKGGDLYDTAEWAIERAEEAGVDSFRYDADGIGASMRGDCIRINDKRKAARKKEISAIAWQGSAAVADPEGIVDGTRGSPGDPGRTNLDYFANAKAQAWWHLRRKFINTFRWVVEGRECAPDEIISINPACPHHMKLVAELTQIQFTTNDAGQIVIIKQPKGTKSPNRADAVMMRFAPKGVEPLHVSNEQVEEVRRKLGGRVRRRLSA